MDVVLIGMTLMLPGHAIGSVRSGGSRCERRIDAAVRTVLAVVAALVTSISIPLAPAEADPDADLASQLDAAIEARIAAMGIPGARIVLRMIEIIVGVNYA
jgi:hypothetical protein